MKFPRRYTGSWKRKEVMEHFMSPIIWVDALRPVHETVKSYCGKAHIVGCDGTTALYSFHTKIAEFTPLARTLAVGEYAAYSPTTLRHFREFVRQAGIKNLDLSADGIKKCLGKKIIVEL